MSNIDPSSCESAYPNNCPRCGKRLLHPQKVKNRYDEELTQNQIYRQHRRTHIDAFDIPEEENGKYVCNDGEDPRLPDEVADVETKIFTVEFHDTMIEKVQVEASNKHEAKDIAELERTFNGELVETVHTDCYSYQDDATLASEEYLKKVGLLDEDWEGILDKFEVTEPEYMNLTSIGAD